MLIHPRELPLANNNSSGEAQCNFQDENIGRSNHTPFGLPQAGHDTPDTDDDLCARWMENTREVIVSLPKNIKHTQEPYEACRDNNLKVLSMHLSSGTKIQQRSEILSEAASSADVDMRVVNDEIISKSDQPVESSIQSEEPVSYTTSITVAKACKPVATEIASERTVSHSNMPHSKGSSHMESDQGSSANKGFESASQSTSLLQRTSDSDMIQESAFKLDHGDSPADEDVFPDIVDEDQILIPNKGKLCNLFLSKEV